MSKWDLPVSTHSPTCSIVIGLGGPAYVAVATAAIAELRCGSWGAVAVASFDVATVVTFEW